MHLSLWSSFWGTLHKGQHIALPLVCAVQEEIEYNSEMITNQNVCREKPSKWHLVELFLLSSVMILSSCGRIVIPGKPLLFDVSLAPNLISPDADGYDDVTLIRYNLSRSSLVSVFFENDEKQRFYFRKNQRRSPGNYSVMWGGTQSDPKTIRVNGGTNTVLSHVLPDGQYRWVVRATDDASISESATGTITLKDGDVDIPKLENFAVLPPVFRPNQDGLRDDWVSISYHLSKEVEFLQVYLVDPEFPTVKFLVAEQPSTIKPKEKGNPTHRYDGGLSLGVDPPSDGTYLIVGEVRDKVGHHVKAERALKIQDSGKPRAEIVQGEISWGNEVGRSVSVPLGEALCFSSIVQNVGLVPIRTNGPWPGAEYEFKADGTYETFNNLASNPHDPHPEWHEQTGALRFGVNFDTTGYVYPFRWAIGRQQDLERLTFSGQTEWYLMPGDLGEVSGCIRFKSRPPGGSNNWWGGLVHEAIGYPNDNVDRIIVTVGTR